MTKISSATSGELNDFSSSKYVDYLEDDFGKTETDIESVMSQINSEMNDALSIFDKSQFTSETATSSGGKSGNSFGESQYEETNSFDSEEAVEDDCSRIVHKGISGTHELALSGGPTESVRLRMSGCTRCTNKLKII